MTGLASSVVNGLLAIKPLAKFAKTRARTMMIDRAETLGVYWRDELKALQARDSGVAMDPRWAEELSAIANPDITYPAYYTTSFHAYDEGNLGWLPAMEVDIAARAVHAKIWPEGDPRAGVNGDAMLRQSYHDVLKAKLPAAPQQIVDLGSSAGRSTFALQQTFPGAQLRGVELSPYFVAVAQHMSQQQGANGHERNNNNSAEPSPSAPSSSAPSSSASSSSEPSPSAPSPPVQWIHAAAEATGLPAASADLVSVCLVFHELPTAAAHDVIAEAHRLVRPGGHFAIMDMNPQCDAFMKMPPYILTLLKSTEPYLDQYFSLDIVEAFQRAGFLEPSITLNSPRHRTIIGQKPV
ncbi:MAG: methyltransferase domain-containing protein [Cyanobacteria bacterium J06598_3]